MGTGLQESLPCSLSNAGLPGALDWEPGRLSGCVGTVPSCSLVSLLYLEM